MLIAPRKNNLPRDRSGNSICTDNENLYSSSRGDLMRLPSMISSKREGKNLLQDLPESNMQMVCHMLDLSDLCKLATVNKAMLTKTQAQQDVWKVKVFKHFQIKMGYEHIRKENLFKIDHMLANLHKQALAEVLRGKRKQKLYFSIWFLIFIFMALIVFPILLIFEQDGVDIPQAILHLPFTLCWLGLIFVAFSFFYTAKQTKKRVENKLCKDDEFSHIPVVYGRKFKHPKMWKFMHYLSKALSVYLYILIFCYLGFFIKAYIVDMSYLTMAIITWVPIGITMSIKILYEMVKSVQFRTGRLKLMKPILKKAVDETITSEMDFKNLKVLEKMKEEDPKIIVTNPREVKYKEKKGCCCQKKRKYYFSYGEEFQIQIDNCIDVGLLNSILIPNLIFGGFFIVCALKLDGIIDTSWFLITIPTWIFIIPIAILIILHGITSPNKNVTMCEKIVISCLVPISFMTSYCLILAKITNYIFLISNCVGVLALYLYTRQLKTGRVQPKEETSEQEENNDEPRNDEN